MQEIKEIIDSDRCVSCLYHSGGTACLAFPNGIPDEIIQGENQHTEPLPNQGNNLVYEEFDLTKLNLL